MVGVVAVSAVASGCGGRLIAGSQTDGMAIIDDDAAPNQRGSLGGAAGGSGDGDSDGGVDSGPADQRLTDSGSPDAARDTSAPDTTDASVRQCTAPAKRCEGKIPQSCDANGMWQASGAACTFACSAGDCTGVCAPGTYRCTGSNRQVCGPNGQWTDYLACPFVCLGTDCAGSCFPGRNQCLSGQLQTCSVAGQWQNTGIASRELLMNPAFDDDPGESSWNNSGIPIVYTATTAGNGDSTPDVAAQSLPHLAWFGGLNRADDQLTQDITIPADASSVMLSFSYDIITNEISAAENDVLDFSVITRAGDVIPIAHLSDNNATSAWTNFTAAVPLSLAGQTVTLQIRSVTNATLVTSIYIDTVSVTAVACP